MAKVLQDDVVIQKRIQENVRTSLDKFAYLLDTAPTFVSYYHQEMIHSTADNNLDSVYQVIGSESPLKFNRIDKFPVYGLDQLSLDRNDGNFGPETDIDINCVVLPGTIIPLENDLMSIEYVNSEGFANEDASKHTLFRITKVVKAIQGTKSFYTLSLTIEPKNIALVEKQVEEEFEFSVPDYEANKVPVFKLPYKRILDIIRKLRAEFVEDYKNLFYEDATSCFVFPCYKGKLVNFYLNYFFEKNEILEFDRFFFNTSTAFRYPSNINRLLADFYKKTIFHKFVKHTLGPNDYLLQFGFEEFDKNIHDPFYSFPDDYVNSVFIPMDISDMVDNSGNEGDDGNSGSGDCNCGNDCNCGCNTPKCPHHYLSDEQLRYIRDPYQYFRDHGINITDRTGGVDMTYSKNYPVKETWDCKCGKEEKTNLFDCYYIGDETFMSSLLIDSDKFQYIGEPVTLSDIVLNIYHHKYDKEFTIDIDEKNKRKEWRIDYETLFKHIDNVSIDTSWESFWIAPFFLYQLRDMENVLTIKENTKKEWARR